MIQSIKNQHIGSTNNLPIITDVFFKKTDTKKPVVIFSHGFKGFKDWGHFNYVAEQMAENELVFVKLNFSHNGTSINNLDGCDETIFSENNFSIELDDLGKVIDWITNNKELAAEIDTTKIYLLGHSRGGAISILKTAEDIRIKKLVTWAAVGDFDNRYDADFLAEWKKTGITTVENGRTGQILPLKYQFYEDYVQHIDRLHIPAAIKKITIPYLIIHGTEDDVIPVDEAIEMNNNCKNAALLIIQNSGHSFEAEHPFQGIDGLHENTKTVIKATINFFKS